MPTLVLRAGAVALATVDLRHEGRGDEVQLPEYDVVANLGDQYSDLIGGYADRAVKLPNPTYYLP